MTRRFDREGGSGKHHAQTLCAMAHLDFNQRKTHSYEQMFQAIIALNLPDEDLYEAYRRMVFNVLARNCDDHTKNTSFILKKGQAWRLAPAYDVTFAHNPSGGWTSQHLMSVNGRFRDFSKDDLLAVSDPYSIGPAKRIFDQVRSAISRWPEFADQAGLPTVKAQEIQSMHLRL
jgi:serine/threonine-protein kinase HipA